MSEINNIVSNSRPKFEKAITHLEQEMMKIRAGKANPNMLHGVMVEAYGSMSPLSSVCNITTPDVRMLQLQVWDKEQIPAIEKAIMQANIGLTPQNDGEVIRINIPPLTEERRIMLVKQAKTELENCKISIRNIRRDTIEDIRKLKNDGVSEDMIKGGENKVQTVTDEFISNAESIFNSKEKEIMTV